MDKVLFASFLTDQVVYREASNLWFEALNSVFRTNDKHELWKTPWLNTRFANGDLVCDGNPIYSAICDAESKAIRIVQKDPDQSETFESWVEATDWVTICDRGVYMLTIVCVLTSGTLARSIELFQRWVDFKGELQLFETDAT